MLTGHGELYCFCGSSNTQSIMDSCGVMVARGKKNAGLFTNLKFVSWEEVSLQPFHIMGAYMQPFTHLCKGAPGNMARMALAPLSDLPMKNTGVFFAKMLLRMKMFHEIPKLFNIYPFFT
eukprot:gene3902-8398_t